MTWMDVWTDRRTVLKSAAGAALSLALPRRARAGEDDTPPDIVLIVLDSLRAASLPVYGNPRDTAPFIANMARRAAVFRRCYSSSTWTRPAVTGLMTGASPVEHGNCRPDKAMPVSQPFFPPRLKERGYQTGYFTANFIIAHGSGMEAHFDRASYEPVENADGFRLVGECRRWLEEGGDGPRFAYAHFFEPHGPCDPPRRFIDRIRAEVRKHPPALDYLPPGGRISPCAEGSHKILGRVPHYQAEVAFSIDPAEYVIRYEANILYADEMVRHLVKTWRGLRPGRKTVWILTADHGECMGEHGHFFDHGKMLAQSLLHVPLIVLDEREPSGRVFELPVSHLDLPNTVLRIAGAGEPLNEDRPRSVFGIEHAAAIHDVYSQHVPFGRGIMPGAGAAFALTRGPWRLTFNECPFIANHCHLGLKLPADQPFADGKAHTPLPRAAMDRPVPLEGGAAVKTFALGAQTAEAGRAYPFAGEAECPAEGVLRLRARQVGGDAVELGAFECAVGINSIRGMFPAMETQTPSGAPPLVTVEASWEARQSWFASLFAGGPAPPWHELTRFPLFDAQLLTENILLAGMEISPRIAAPGSAARVSIHWRHVDTTPAPTRVKWRMRHSTGVAVQEGTSQLSAMFRGQLKTQAGWFRVPNDAPPGKYEYVFSPDGETREIVGAGIEIPASWEEAFRKLLDAEAGFGDFNWFGIPPEALESESAKALLDALSRRHPGEGHFDYLRALAETDADARRRLLDTALAKNPGHLAALHARRAMDADAPAPRELVLATPARELDYRFPNGLRLYGFNLERAPESPDAGKTLYLTLYWECRHKQPDPLFVDLWIETAAGAKIQSWQPGAQAHPCHHWSIGEAVAETVRVNAPGGDGAFSLDVILLDFWRFAYGGMKNEDLAGCYLAALGSDGKPDQKARLGTFDWAELPVSERDLEAGKRSNPAFFQLHNLDRDPWERTNLAAEEPEIFERMKSGLVRHIESLGNRAPAPAEGGETGPGDLPEDAQKRLRSLGYIH